LLESLGKYAECADIQLAAGSLKDAARFFLLGNRPFEAAACLYRLLLDLSPLGTDFTTMAEKSQVRSILNQLEPLSVHLDPAARQVASIIRQATRDQPSFGQLLEHRSNLGPAEATFLLDAAMQFVPPMDSLTIEEVMQAASDLDQ
jgi:hypothetical protein